MGRDGLDALRAVLPAGTPVYAVGGVGPADFAAWRAAGADGFGLGSSLFQPGWPVARVAEQARAQRRRLRRRPRRRRRLTGAPDGAQVPGFAQSLTDAY